MKRRAEILVVLALLLLFGGCARKMPPAVRTEFGAQDRVSLLRTELENIFADPQLENAFWGVMVQSVQTGEILFRKNHTKFFMPASNMKIPVAAAALLKLGPEYIFETAVQTDGEIREGALHGNLIIIGSGDPTISGRFYGGAGLNVFQEWTNKLKALGIQRIEGNIIGVDDVFDNERLGMGWAWNNLPYGSSPEISGLQFNENVIDLRIAPAQKTGEPVTLVKTPDTGYVRVVNRCITEAKGTEAKFDLRREAGSNAIIVSGNIPLDEEPFTQKATVSNPTAFFVFALLEALEQNGIDVTGESFRASDKAFRPNPEAVKQLFSHRSPPLTEILSVLLKFSQNLYAETLVKTLGREFIHDGSFEAGRNVIQEALSTFGIPESGYVITDGSGLSRYNYLTPDTLIRILRGIYHHERFKIFYEALPVAGVNGTVESRMKGTGAEGNVRAKTGAIANVRSISGYVTTRDGEILAFVMIANNFNIPNEVVEYTQDLALERLADFSRRSEL